MMRAVTGLRGLLLSCGGAIGMIVAFGLAAAQDTDPVCDLSGYWRSTMGVMHLVHDIEKGDISAVFQAQAGQGRLSGTESAGAFEIEWAAPPSYAAPDDAGTATIRPVASCDELKGQFTAHGGTSETWLARRISIPDEGWSLLADPARLNLEAQRLRTLAEVLKRESAKVDERLPSLEKVAEAVGPSPDSLARWVRDNTQLVPYRGSLRGSEGG